MMQIHILDAENHLQAFESQIRESAAHAISSISQYLDLDLDIRFSHDPEHCNPKLGIGGGAFNSGLLHIFLDSSNDNIASSIDNELLAVLAHEIHHCVRMEKVEDLTLADRLVTEGLACQFEVEVNGNVIPSFLPAARIEAWETYFTGMKSILESKDFCSDTVFLGKCPEVFPKYAGYAVGPGLVEKYLASQQASAATCVQVPTGRTGFGAGPLLQGTQ
jgi:uncharacterized protein YjaZ